MKKLLILLFSLLISFNSYGEWKEVTSSVEYNDIYYVDFSRLTVTSGEDELVEYSSDIDFDIVEQNVLWWDLRDGPIPISDKYFSGTTYSEGDCNNFRFRNLSFIDFTGRMGEGERVETSENNLEWKYPSPDSVSDLVLQSVCDYVELSL